MEIFACKKLILITAKKLNTLNTNLFFDICQYYISGILMIHPLTSNALEYLHVFPPDLQHHYMERKLFSFKIINKFLFC